MSVSLIYLLRVSLVILFWVLSTTTLPIVSGTAYDFVSGGSDKGVSLFVCGKSCVNGWEKLSSLNGVTVGLLDALTTVK